MREHADRFKGTWSFPIALSFSAIFFIVLVSIQPTVSKVVVNGAFIFLKGGSNRTSEKMRAKSPFERGKNAKFP